MKVAHTAISYIGSKQKWGFYRSTSGLALQNNFFILDQESPVDP